MFSSIVSRASTHEVLSTGVAGSYNGALQVVCITKSIPVCIVLSFQFTVHLFDLSVCMLCDYICVAYNVGHQHADVNGVSGAFTTSADTGELFRKVLQAQP